MEKKKEIYTFAKVNVMEAEEMYHWPLTSKCK